MRSCHFLLGFGPSFSGVGPSFWCLALRGLARPFLLKVWPFLLGGWLSQGLALPLGFSGLALPSGFWPFLIGFVFVLGEEEGVGALGLPFSLRFGPFLLWVWPFLVSVALPSQGVGPSILGAGPSFWGFGPSSGLLIMGPSCSGFGPFFSGFGPSFSGFGPSCFGFGPSFCRLALSWHLLLSSLALP